MTARALAFVAALLSGAAYASAALASPAERCFEAAAAAERIHKAPAGLLQAISLVETGRTGPSGWEPWPWTINVDGRSRRFDDPVSAVIAAEAAYDAGASVDVGCFQVNLSWHGDKASVSELFDPMTSALYAARFLADLRSDAGSWQRAAGYYHSRNERRAMQYRRRVIVAKNSDAIRERRAWSRTRGYEIMRAMQAE
ncbi:MAG: lytic transglycosylase domain-containing protein [Pseudomonadota bacterium]